MNIDKNHTSRVPRFRKKSKIGPKKKGLHFSILAQKITSQKYGQIVPTPCGSILHHTKPSQKPYNQKNQFWAISSNIPYYSHDGWSIIRRMTPNPFINLEKVENRSGKNQFSLLGFPDSGKSQKQARKKIVHTSQVPRFRKMSKIGPTTNSYTIFSYILSLSYIGNLRITNRRQE